MILEILERLMNLRIGEECCGIVAQKEMAFEVIVCKNKMKNKQRDYYEKQRSHEKKEAKVEVCLS